MDTGISKIRDFFYKEKFTFLLFSLFLYEIVAPFFEGFIQRGLFAKISFLMILFAAIFTGTAEQKSWIVILILAFLSFILFWLKLFFTSEMILRVDIILKILFFICMIFIIARDFYKSDSVSRDTISAALIGYLLLTLLWANLYFLLELLHPNSFTVIHETILSDPSILKFFSFVTITTLGYGDITPITSQARSLTVLEAFIGQMYVAVLIARMVGIHTAQTLGKKN
jgi:voltage-gated potassium channel